MKDKYIPITDEVIELLYENYSYIKNKNLQDYSISQLEDKEHLKTMFDEDEIFILVTHEKQDQKEIPEVDLNIQMIHCPTKDLFVQSFQVYKDYFIRQMDLRFFPFTRMKSQVVRNRSSNPAVKGFFVTSLDFNLLQIYPKKLAEMFNANLLINSITNFVNCYNI